MKKQQSCSWPQVIEVIRTLVIAFTKLVQIYVNISENTLPLTPNEFTCLGRVVDYLKIRHELYAKAQLTPLNPNLFFDFGEKDTFGWI